MIFVVSQTRLIVTKKNLIKIQCFIANLKNQSFIFEAFLKKLKCLNEGKPLNYFTYLQKKELFLSIFHASLGTQ